MEKSQVRANDLPSIARICPIVGIAKASSPIRYLDRAERLSVRPSVRPSVRCLMVGSVKERLNRRFLISPYRFHPAPWAGRAPRLSGAKTRSPFPPPRHRCVSPWTFFEPGMYTRTRIRAVRISVCRGASLYSRHSKGPLLLLPCRGPEL